MKQKTRYYLPFESVGDLKDAVHRIEKATIHESQGYRQFLRDKGIKYTPLDEYSVAIDISQIDGDVSGALTHENHLVNKVYSELGVLTTVNEDTL